MPLIALASFIVIVLAVVAALVAACAFAVFTLVIGLALRSTRWEWLSPFLIWIPSLATAFTVTFTAFTVFAVINSWSFPASLLELIGTFLIGELLCLAAGCAIALRTKNHRPAASEHAINP